MSTTPAAQPRKLNRRGVAAREKLLSTALEMLGSGRPEAVSINLIAREAGLSWGSVQNLFGDSDGFWSAVVDQIIEGEPALWSQPQSNTIAGRVAELAAFYNEVLASSYAVAFDTLRSGLPRPREVLAETHPQTAAALSRLEERWSQSFVGFFDGIPGPELDQKRALDVAVVLPSALRGLRIDLSFGTEVDAERVNAALVAALTAYLEG